MIHNPLKFIYGQHIDCKYINQIWWLSTPTPQKKCRDTVCDESGAEKRGVVGLREDKDSRLSDPLTRIRFSTWFQSTLIVSRPEIGDPSTFQLCTLPLRLSFLLCILFFNHFDLIYIHIYNLDFKAVWVFKLTSLVRIKSSIMYIYSTLLFINLKIWGSLMDECEGLNGQVNTSGKSEWVGYVK